MEDQRIRENVLALIDAGLGAVTVADQLGLDVDFVRDVRDAAIARDQES